MACIQEIFGPIADKLVIEQAPFLDLTEQTYHQLKERILAHWDEIQELAGKVPGPEQMAGLLAQAGGATHPVGLNLTDEEVFNPSSTRTTCAIGLPSASWCASWELNPDLKYKERISVCHY